MKSTLNVTFQVPEQTKALSIAEIAEAVVNTQADKQAEFFNIAGKIAHEWEGYGDSDVAGAMQNFQWWKMAEDLDWFGWQMIKKMAEQLDDFPPERVL